MIHLVVSISSTTEAIFLLVFVVLAQADDDPIPNPTTTLTVSNVFPTRETAVTPADLQESLSKLETSGEVQRSGTRVVNEQDTPCQIASFGSVERSSFQEQGSGFFRGL